MVQLTILLSFSVVAAYSKAASSVLDWWVIAVTLPLEWLD